MSYKKNFLNQVVFQLNFNTIEVLKVSLNPDFSDLCKLIMGVECVEQDAVAVNLIIQAAGGSPIQQQQKLKTWLYIGEKYRLQIQNSFISISTTKYEGHQDFHKLIFDVFSKFSSIYNPFINKITLRYVNTVSFPNGSTFDFDGLINEGLVNPALLFQADDLTRSIGQITMKDNEGISVNFTFGFLNTSQFPNKIIKRDFTLDYDCFVVLNDNLPEIKTYVSKLRAKANYLFDKSILPGLKEIMNN